MTPEAAIDMLQRVITRLSVTIQKAAAGGSEEWLEVGRALQWAEAIRQEIIEWKNSDDQK